jgi:hypothetical protein
LLRFRPSLTVRFWIYVVVLLIVFIILSDRIMETSILDVNFNATDGVSWG